MVPSQIQTYFISWIQDTHTFRRAGEDNIAGLQVSIFLQIGWNLFKGENHLAAISLLSDFTIQEHGKTYLIQGRYFIDGNK